jgi:uncharacterized protein YegP (UPF0339 family)
MAAKYEISKDNADTFRFQLKAANGEIIAASRGYDHQGRRRKGIEPVKTNAAAVKVAGLTEQEPAHH